jgi:hypothetical protein
MRDTIIIRAKFSSRDDAEEARQRLEYAGFAHNSINITRVGDDYELAIHTRPENRARVQDCIEGSDLMFEARRFGRQISEHSPSAGQTALLFGVIGAVGGVLYYAYTRRRDLWAMTYPTRDRSAVHRLYETHREPTRAMGSKPDCDLPENSQENLDVKLDHALEETFPTSDPVSVSITR